MGKSSSDQQTQTQSQTSPWSPAQPVLQDILSGIQNQVPNYQANGAEQNALTNLQNNTAALPNFAPQAGNVTGQFLNGDPTGLLNSGLTNYTNTLNPIATGNLDPTQTPGIQNLLSTIRNDVSNSVNSQFAGAGRDLSGLNQQALARGISQGEAQPLLNQYNQNIQNALQAAGGIQSATSNTANAITGNQAQGFNLASALPTLAAGGPTANLSALQQSQSFPLQNLGMLANLTVPIAGLGGQQTGSSYGRGTSSPNPLSYFMGGSNSAATGVTGALGTGLGILGAFL